MSRHEPRNQKPRTWPLLPWHQHTGDPSEAGSDSHSPGNDPLSLAEANLAMIPRGVKMGTGCTVHTHDAWVPLERHHVWPLGMGGPDREDNKITVCCNGHYAIHACIDHLIRYGEDPPWELMQHFGPKVRQRAEQGWRAAGEPRTT